MDDPVEHLTSRWLSGRGTRVLYLAIAVTMAGALMVGQSVTQAKAETAVSVETAVELATEVSRMCGGAEFRVKHEGTCARAAEILKDPSGGVGTGGVGGLQVVDAAGGQP